VPVQSFIRNRKITLREAGAPCILLSVDAILYTISFGNVTNIEIH
jgi:hypothetical protein